MIDLTIKVDDEVLSHAEARARQEQTSLAALNPEKKARVRELLASEKERGGPVLSTQVLREFYVKVRKLPRPPSAEEVDRAGRADHSLRPDPSPVPLRAKRSLS